MDLTEETYYTSLYKQPELSEFLTPRLVEIAKLVAQGLADKEIAEEMTISNNTLKAQQMKLRDRLGVRARASIAVFVITGWLPTGAACPTPLADFARSEYSTRNRAA